MIAHDQALFPLEPLQDFFKIDRPKKHIAKDIYRVVTLYTAVPVCNQSFVHLCGAGEGTAAKADDVFVPEMGIRSKINHVAFLLPPNKNRAAKHDSSARS